ncbi:hypothetical protein IAU60_006666 [Kwoniella sp. DSM 27419]
MDQQNRLLAMLKSATSGPSTPSSATPPIITSPPSSHLTAPSGQTGSPREPTPTPPPSSFQTVSLQDLFKGIQSPPPPPSTGGIVSPPPVDQKSRLLGMLNTIGQGSNGAMSPSVNSAAQSPAPSTERHDPLAALRAGHPSFQSTSPTAQGPVVQHVTSPPAQVSVQPSAVPALNDQSIGMMTASAPIRHEASPAPETKPKKSMFDFISPFDAFDQPKSRQLSTSSPPLRKDASPAPDAHAHASHGDHAESKLAKIKSVEKLGGELKESATVQRHQPSPIGGRAKTPAQASETGSTQQDAESIVEQTWQVGKIIQDGAGQGPKALSTHTVIDLSKPNLDSLVTGALQVRPTTLMRPNSLKYEQGRRVAMTDIFFAYAMSKGRVRCIDSRSGARLVIQPPSTSAGGSVVDIAATSRFVAVIGQAGGFAVHLLPDGWAKDDPKVQLVFSCDDAQTVIGQPTKVEWVKKEGKNFLALGGPRGVIVFDPTLYGGEAHKVSIGEVIERTKVLKTDGLVADFCLNHSHQAIGLLSETGHCTLYNVANSNRVWHRPLPASPSAGVPSSIQFCESNILVGRSKNTHFDLIQITVDLAVLSTIKFVSPSPAPEELHHAHAVYDSAKSLLFVAPFSRGSLYAFRYALKGQQPIKDVSKPDGPRVIGFASFAEFPLEPVLSLVSARKNADDDAELFFATSTGFSQATIPRSTCDSLKNVKHTATEQRIENTASPVQTVGGKPTTSKGSARIELPDLGRQAKSGPSSKASSTRASPIAVKVELPSTPTPREDSNAVTSSQQDETIPAAKMATSAAVPAQVGVHGITQDDLDQALKRTEAALMGDTRQAIQQEVASLSAGLNRITSSDIGSEIANKVEKQIKGSLTSMIGQEFKKNVIPAATASIQTEIRTVTSNQIPAAIFDALQTVPKELERGLGPLVQRTITDLVQNAVDRAVQEAIQHTLLPAVNQASSSLVDQIMSEMKSEMLQIRKGLEPPVKEDRSASDQLIRGMAASIADLQKQLASVAIQLRSNGSTGGPAPQSVPPAQSNGVSPVVTAPPTQPTVSKRPGPQAPTPSQLEDAFLAALGTQTTAAIVQLVGDHLAVTEYCLPLQGKSPLSQAVLLTLLHRLAIALVEVSPAQPIFVHIATWEKRTAALIDPRDPNITGYITRVLNVVQTLLGQAMGNLQRYPADLNTQNHLNAVRSIQEVVAHKMAM